MLPSKRKLFSTTNVFKEFYTESFFEGDALNNCSINEGVDFIVGSKYKGVQLYFLDMSTNSVTGTFKDWVACYTVAYCKKNSIKEFVTQSSGNTANALAAYCEKNSIKVHIFYLKENKQKLKTRFYQSREFITLHEVTTTEEQMKVLTKKYADEKNIPWLPDFNIQIKANSIRADVVDHISKVNNIRFDWVSQALSSGYGVFGFYDGLRRLGVKPSKGYKLIGVQQTAICPFVKHFSPHLLSNDAQKVEEILERTLFRSTPTDNLYHLMSNILTEFGGEFSLVSANLYDKLRPLASKILNDAGIFLAENSSGEYFEKSGIINFIGVLNLIEKSIISEGESVLISITGGCCSSQENSNSIKPEHIY